MAVVISDDFNRADSTDLGADWTERVEQGTGLEILDQTLAAGGSAPSESGVHSAIVVHNTPLDSPDMVVTFKAQCPTGGGPYKVIWVHLRYPTPDDAASACYYVRVAGGIGDIAVMRALGAGDLTHIGTWAVSDDLPTAWQEYEIHVWNEAEAVVFQLWINGEDCGQLRDETAQRIVTGSYVGLQIYACRNFPVQLDDFQTRVRGAHLLTNAVDCGAHLLNVQCTVADDFNRANNANLGSLWQTTVAYGTFGILSNRLEASLTVLAYAICKVEPYPGNVTTSAEVVYGLAAPSSTSRFELRFRMPGTTYDSGPFYALVFEQTGGGSKASAGLSLWRFLADGDIDNATELWYDNTYYLTNVTRTLQVKVFDRSDRVRIEIWVDGAYFAAHEDTASTRIEAGSGNYVGLVLKSVDPAPGNLDNDLRVDNFAIGPAGHIYTDAIVTAHAFCEPFLAAVDLNVGPLRADAVCAPVTLVAGVNYWAHGPRIQAGLWGKARITDTISGTIVGRARLLDPNLEAILVWRGVNRWPDTSEDPLQTINAGVGTEYTTPLTVMPEPPTLFYFVLQRRNALGLRSAFQRIGPLVVGADGYLGPQPSPLSAIGLLQAEGAIYVCAEYRPLADGDHAATQAFFWYTYAQGSEPADPWELVYDGTAVLTLQNVDGIVAIRKVLDVGAVSAGLQIKVCGYTRYLSSLVQDAWVDSEVSPVAALTAIAPAPVDLDGVDLSIAAAFGQGVPG